MIFSPLILVCVYSLFVSECGEPRTGHNSVRVCCSVQFHHTNSDAKAYYMTDFTCDELSCIKTRFLSINRSKNKRFLSGQTSCGLFVIYWLPQKSDQHLTNASGLYLHGRDVMYITAVQWSTSGRTLSMNRENISGDQVNISQLSLGFLLRTSNDGPPVSSWSGHFSRVLWAVSVWHVGKLVSWPDITIQNLLMTRLTFTCPQTLYLYTFFSPRWKFRFCYTVKKKNTHIKADPKIGVKGSNRLWV